MMNESTIIQCILAGDREQYAQLVERYHIGLILYCERLVRDRADAEDIAQRAFIRAYQQLSSFDDRRAHFSTWLYRIARNLAIDHLRTHRAHVPLDEVQLPAPPDRSFETAEAVSEMRAAVARLARPEHRRVIEAYYWEGKPYQEIAAELNVPINTVKSWLRRAKAHLKEVLS